MPTSVELIRNAACFLMFGIIQISSSYNVHTFGVQIIRSSTLEMKNSNKSEFFGYRVLALPLVGNNKTENLLIAGAPKDPQLSDESSSRGRVPYNETKVDEQDASGNLFLCYSNDSCSSVCSTIERNFTQLNARDAFGMTLTGGNSGNSDIISCSPNEVIKCPYANLLMGSCFKSRDYGNQWERIPLGIDSKCPSDRNIDIIFALDASSSVLQYFDLIRNWVLNITRVFPTDSSYQIGIFTYSQFEEGFWHSYAINLVVPFAPYTNRTALEEKMLNEERPASGSSYIPKALDASVIMLRNSSRFNSRKTTQLIVIITDGIFNLPRLLRKASANIQNNGIEVFAVAIGSNINRNNLQIITGLTDDSNIFTVSSFGELSSIVKSLQSSIVTLEGTSINQTNDLQQAQIGFSALQRKFVLGCKCIS